MGLNPEFNGDGGCERLGEPIALCAKAQIVLQRHGSPGMLHYQTGYPDVAGDCFHPPREGTMLQAIAIAFRRTAALAAVHSTTAIAADGGRAAGGSGAGARAAARSAGEDVRLHVVAPIVCGRSEALTQSSGEGKNKKRT